MTRWKSTVTVSWPTNQDQDDLSLRYNLYRDDTLTKPIHSAGARSTFWKRPRLSHHDSSLVAGKKYLYWIEAVDASSNVVRSANTSFTG